MTFTVTLPYPVSANRIWRTRLAMTRERKQYAQTYLSEEAKAFKDQVGWLLKSAGVRSPLAGRVSVSFVLFPHRPADYRSRQRKYGVQWDDTVTCVDLDNAIKVLLDAMKGIAFGDDALVHEIYGRRAEPDGEAGRMVVTVSQIIEERQISLFGVEST